MINAVNVTLAISAVINLLAACSSEESIGYRLGSAFLGAWFGICTLWVFGLLAP